MKAIIIHGTKGSPQGNWFPWLSDHLQKLGVETLIPKMPTPEGQTLHSWTANFELECGSITPETILIGHSCGASFLLRMLEKSKFEAACTILVAPVLREIGIPEFDLLNSTFLHAPFDWNRIIAHAGKLFFFMGDDDPYVPQNQLIEMAHSLGLSPRVIPGGGHLNSETGYTSFPPIAEILKPLLARD